MHARLCQPPPCTPRADILASAAHARIWQPPPFTRAHASRRCLRVAVPASAVHVDARLCQPPPCTRARAAIAMRGYTGRRCARAAMPAFTVHARLCRPAAPASRSPARPVAMKCVHISVYSHVFQLRDAIYLLLLARWCIMLCRVQRHYEFKVCGIVFKRKHFSARRRCSTAVPLILDLYIAV